MTVKSSPKSPCPVKTGKPVTTDFFFIFPGVKISGGGYSVNLILPNKTQNKCTQIVVILEARAGAGGEGEGTGGGGTSAFPLFCNYKELLKKNVFSSLSSLLPPPLPLHFQYISAVPGSKVVLASGRRGILLQTATS